MCVCDHFHGVRLFLLPAQLALSCRWGVGLVFGKSRALDSGRCGLGWWLCHSGPMVFRDPCDPFSHKGSRETHVLQQAAWRAQAVVVVRVSRCERAEWWVGEDTRSPELPLSPCCPLFPPALIVGGGVGILFAIFLVLLLMYRMKKKDEGSYDLGKKPIYKKAPTNEFYA